MDDTRAARAKSLLWAALFVLCVGGTIALFAAGSWLSRSFVQLWRGYYTILVSADFPSSQVQDRLARAGLSVIDADNSLVRFDDFSSEASVSVSRLSSRLDPLDPRYDPYMKALGSYFRTGLWNIYYVKLDAPPALAFPVLGHALHGLQWKSADVNGRSSLLCLALLALVALAARFRTARARAANVAQLAGLLPWLPAALYGSYAGTLAGALIFVGWSAALDLGFPLLRYYLDYGAVERDRLLPIGGLLLSTLFAATVMVGVNSRLLGLVVRGSGYLVTLACSLSAYELLRAQRRQHRLFIPLRMVAGTRRLRLLPAGTTRATWIAFVLLLSPVIAFFDYSGGVDIPTPVVYPGAARNSWGALGRVWQLGNERGLPGLADYVAHRAYQSGLSFGASYSFPQPDERLYERNYRRVGNRIVESLVVVKIYTREWYHRILTDGEGVVPLIEKQPGVILPTWKPLYDPGFPVSYLAVFWLAMLVILLPSTFLRRAGALQTLGRSAGEVIVVPSAAGVPAQRLPHGTPRKRVLAAEEATALVSDGKQ